MLREEKKEFEGDVRKNTLVRVRGLQKVLLRIGGCEKIVEHVEILLA